MKRISIILFALIGIVQAQTYYEVTMKNCVVEFKDTLTLNVPYSFNANGLSYREYSSRNVEVRDNYNKNGFDINHIVNFANRSLLLDSLNAWSGRCGIGNISMALSNICVTCDSLPIDTMYLSGGTFYITQGTDTNSIDLAPYLQDYAIDTTYLYGDSFLIVQNLDTFYADFSRFNGGVDSGQVIGDSLYLFGGSDTTIINIDNINAIPLTGTDSLRPVTGDIEINAEGSGGTWIRFNDSNYGGEQFKIGWSEDEELNEISSNTGIWFTNDLAQPLVFFSLSNWKINLNSQTILSGLSTDDQSLLINSDGGVGNNKGISGVYYYGVNYDSLSYVQKKYVDDLVTTQATEEFTATTSPTQTTSQSRDANQSYQVYINGLLLPSSGVVSFTGTTLVLADAPLITDIIQVVYFY